MVGASDDVRARSLLTGRATINFTRKLATAVRVTSETAGGEHRSCAVVCVNERGGQEPGDRFGTTLLNSVERSYS
jgi:hypothetical protein